MAAALLPLSVALMLASGGGAEVVTPAPGSAERTAILEAVRAEIAADLPRPVVFRVHRLGVAGGWAFLAATPQQPDGRPYDYRGTRYQAEIDDGLFDDNLFALLQRAHGRWRVRARIIGATDVPFEDWSEEYGAPAAIFR
jgi:hypothetical protein